MPTETRKETSLAAELEQRLVARTAHVGVIGLGYVGLPLIVELARAGFNATGVDLDERKIAAINRGESYIPDVPTSDVAEFQKAGRLRATSDAKAIGEFDTINICVPTPPQDGDPDLSHVRGQRLPPTSPGQLIVPNRRPTPNDRCGAPDSRTRRSGGFATLPRLAHVSIRQIFNFTRNVRRSSVATRRPARDSQGSSIPRRSSAWWK
jgi:hypothetical protein